MNTAVHRFAAGAAGLSCLVAVPFLALVMLFPEKSLWLAVALVLYVAKCFLLIALILIGLLGVIWAFDRVFE